MAIYIPKLKNLTLLQRLELKTIKHEGGCWEWQGPFDTFGHGRTKIFGKMDYIHRFAWRQFFGEIPEGRCVLHRCDNPPCWNPDHLFIGTRVDNTSDMVAKNRQAKGVTNANAKLTDEIVLQMRSLWSQGWNSVQLGRRFGVTKNTAIAAATGRSWKHLNSF